MHQTTRVLHLGLKDRHAPALQEQARTVNFLWNYCNELSVEVWEREQRFLSGYDFHPITKGAGKAGLALHSGTIQAVAEESASRRKQARKIRLRWRASRGARSSLGWISLRGNAIRYRDGQLFFGQMVLSLWGSYGMADYELGAGNISEDSRGRWCINVCVKLGPQQGPRRSDVTNCVGIDLGLKKFATLSDGHVVNVRQHYRKLEDTLAKAQHARKNASALAKTRMAKSLLDAFRSAFRTMLQYKCDYAGVWFDEVDEAYSTQTCACCKRRTGPSIISRPRESTIRVRTNSKKSMLGAMHRSRRVLCIREGW